MERQQQEDSDAEDGAIGVVVRLDHFETDLRRLDAEDAAALQNSGEPLPRRHLGLVDEYRYPSVVGDVRRRPSEIRSIIRAFERFVDLLERRPVNGSFRSVNFHFILFVPEFWRWFRDGDIERLFSGALPALLPTLDRLHFSMCCLPSLALNMFLNRLSEGSLRETSNLTDLIINDCYVSSELCAPAIAEVIRSNFPLRFLVFRPRGKMNKDECQLLFDSLPVNTNLRRVEVGVAQLFEDGPVLPVDLSASSSALRRLGFEVATWTEEGKASLARQLKANTKLEELHVVFDDTTRTLSLPHRPWIEMLEAHNYTLLALEERSVGSPRSQDPAADQRIAACLRRNGRIQQALAQLPTYRVASSALLPLALELVSGLPLLLYRFVRGGDMDALVRHVLVHAAAAARTCSNKRIRTA
jgi:hypothetical protein